MEPLYLPLFWVGLFVLIVTTHEGYATPWAVSLVSFINPVVASAFGQCLAFPVLVRVEQLFSGPAAITLETTLSVWIKKLGKILLPSSFHWILLSPFFQNSPNEAGAIPIAAFDRQQSAHPLPDGQAG